MSQTNRKAQRALPGSKISVRPIANHADFEDQDPGRGWRSKQDKCPVIRPEKVFTFILRGDLDPLAIVNDFKFGYGVNEQYAGRVGHSIEFILYGLGIFSGRLPQVCLVAYGTNRSKISIFAPTQKNDSVKSYSKQKWEGLVAARTIEKIGAANVVESDHVVLLALRS
jgi:hypothetical protein